jgi:hypothetical protein
VIETLIEGASDPMGFWVYAGILEYLQHFSPRRHPGIEDFAASRELTIGKPPSLGRNSPSSVRW